MNQNINERSDNHFNFDFIDKPNQSDEMEVELASPWKRIGSVIINNIIMMIAILPTFIPLIYLLFTQPDLENINENDSFLVMQYMPILMGVSFLLSIALMIRKAIWMSKYGQSIGKKILKIKVIDLNGQNPGFVGTVLMREVIYQLIIIVIVFILCILAYILYLINDNQKFIDTTINGINF